jgi:hypothetical protein
MKRLLVLAVLITVLVMVTTVTAFAGYSWCSTDPNIQLPDGRGVAHLIVAVPEGYQGVAVTVEVWAPAGSRIVGKSSKNVTAILHTGDNDNQLIAQTAAGFPVLLTVKYRGAQWEPYIFESGTGTAEWTLN